MKEFEEKSDNDGIHTSIIFKISGEFLDGELMQSPKDDKLVIIASKLVAHIMVCLAYLYYILCHFGVTIMS